MTTSPAYLRIIQSPIYLRIKQIASARLAIDPNIIEPQSNFVEDLGADSLDTVELVMALEEEFKVEIPDQSAEHMKTVGDAVEYIEKKLQVA